MINSQTEEKKVFGKFLTTILLAFPSSAPIIPFFVGHNSNFVTPVPLEIPASLLARFYLTYFQSGVVQMHWTMESTNEFMLTPGILAVECSQASLIQYFDNGSQVCICCVYD
jgi:hypothetical protein